MTGGLRKFALTAHVSLAVGWIGAVAAYLVLVVAAMTTKGTHTLRAAWIAMELIGWYLIVPLALASLLTGLVMALGTPWGLFRHYWTIISLILTVIATAVLLQHMQTVSTFASVAADGSVDVGGLRGALPGELLHAGVGLLILLVINALNVYKPMGMTAYGSRRASEAAWRSRSPHVDRSEPSRGSVAVTPFWVRVLGFHALGFAVLFVIMHLVGRGGLH
ncbi:MAG: DUF2269 domain-containing protein [Candidatus Rokuibacteriota bacterium]